MRAMVRVAAFACVASMGLQGCSRTPSNEALRSERFGPLHRAARSIDGAIAVGVTYVRFGELLQVFATELLLATDRAKDDADRALISAYSEVLDAYKDSAAVWKQANESSSQDWMKGRTFVTEPLQTIAQKYKLAVKQERIGTTEHTYSSLDPDAMQKIWLVAEERSKKARDIYLSPSKG
jgi:hypothetical protein